MISVMRQAPPDAPVAWPSRASPTLSLTFQSYKAAGADRRKCATPVALCVGWDTRAGNTSGRPLASSKVALKDAHQAW